MSVEAEKAVQILTKQYLQRYPWDAALQIESMAPEEAVSELQDQSAEELVLLWRHLVPTVAAEVLLAHGPERRGEILSQMAPNDAVRLLTAMEETDKNECLAVLPDPVERDLRAMLEYPDDSAGRLMDTRAVVFRSAMSVKETLDELRRTPAKTARNLFLVDKDNKLSAKVPIQDLAIADADATLSSLAQPLTAVVDPLTAKKEVADILEHFKLADLPVVDGDGVLLGVVYHATLMDVVQESATVDMQKMVGASKDERALSTATFAVRKRLPWLQINLLTAFMAAAVVGLFEDTIAKFTALAVLLPVVAGQSGNAGAQALAVTMRGLALREINTSQWWPVTFKEINVGLLNGVAVAITCGIGVFVWSGSIGLVLVIAISMVLAMVAAGFAGALVPIMLTKFGQDPAQSSSIILTTVTDIAGFFSFLGIATVLAGML
jgi:magnesium transporter